MRSGCSSLLSATVLLLTIQRAATIECLQGTSSRASFNTENFSTEDCSGVGCIITLELQEGDFSLSTGCKSDNTLDCLAFQNMTKDKEQETLSFCCQTGGCTGIINRINAKSWSNQKIVNTIRENMEDVFLRNKREVEDETEAMAKSEEADDIKEDMTVEEDTDDTEITKVNSEDSENNEATVGNDEGAATEEGSGDSEDLTEDNGSEEVTTEEVEVMSTDSETEVLVTSTTEDNQENSGTLDDSSPESVYDEKESPEKIDQKSSEEKTNSDFADDQLIFSSGVEASGMETEDEGSGSGDSVDGSGMEEEEISGSTGPALFFCLILNILLTN